MSNFRRFHYVVAVMSFFMSVPGALHAMTRLSAEATAALLARDDLVVCQDTDAALSVWTGSKKGLPDATASDQSAAWFKTTPESWNLQWHWDARLFASGLHCELFAVVKVKKSGGTGEAFKGGVWDKVQWQPIIATTVVGVEAVDGDVWMVFRLGSVRPEPGQYVWIGTSGKNHDNVSEVWLDRFIMAPDRARPEEMRYRELVRAHPDCPTVSLSAQEHASATLDIDGVSRVSLATFSAPSGQDATAAVSVRFGQQDGALSAPIALPCPAGFHGSDVDLAARAPRGWSGLCRLSFELDSGKGRSALTAAILRPARRELGLVKVALEPVDRTRVASAVVDAATLGEARRQAFVRPLRRLNGLLPGAAFAVRTGSALRKVLHRTLEPGWIREGAGDVVHLTAARHEYEGAQLVLLPLTPNRVAGINCSASAFHPAVAGTPSAAVPTLAVNPVGYVKTEDLGYPVEHVGWWPDPLMPEGPVDLLPDRTQAVWLTAYVPEATLPGEYRATVSVVGAGQTVSIPVQLRVRSFALPRETHLRSSFWLFRYHIQRFYGWKDVPWDVYRRYIDLATSHRLTPIDHSIEGGSEPFIKVYREEDGRLTFDYTEQDRFLSYTLDTCHANAFNVGYACWHHSVMANLPAIDRQTGKKIRIQTEHLSEEYVRNYTHFLRSYCAHLKEKGWFDKAYHQMIDEPRKDYLDTVKQLHKLSHEAVPDLKVLITACWPPRLPEDSVDIWVPLTPSFKPEEAPRLRAQGDETWWYVCCAPKRPHANFFIDYPAIDHRILFWQSWKYGAQGVLYWGLNYWTRIDKDVRANVPAGADDRWPNAPWVPNPFAGINGDGYSMYPGPGGTPLSSVRLEVMRDGLEDYEYLYLLRGLCDRLRREKARDPEAGALVAAAERLLDIDSTIVESMTSYTSDPGILLERREQLAEALEKGLALLRASGSEP